ncbi:heavy metal response regulator transcription factor [Microvirgula aerodenitrificans]|uniref:heavy metal response regulator transcription factor n=1 Tax=Microvirgula aerodenitrificans TaxID=57480 RepID=UPI000AAECB4A|nr:winged helix family two component heavy metal response transcriptional regulator [Microvirgula sp. AG722]
MAVLIAVDEAPRRTMKILIAEDDEKTAGYIRKGLIEHGYVVDTAQNGTDALHLALTGQYDLLLLDVMMPGLDGFAVTAALRATSQPVAVLLLTARDTVEDRVRGLETGADDYLIKPFAFSELLARVKSILRRTSARPGDSGDGHLRIADLDIEPLRQRACRAGRPLDLTAREFTLLSLLARRCGEVVTRMDIAEQVWDMHFDFDSNLIDVAVARLRRKVDDPFPSALIHTVRGSGYVLEAR